MPRCDHFDGSDRRRRLTAERTHPTMTQVPGNPSFYDVLGVAPTATSEEVRAAYRRLSRQTHPDAGGNGALFRLVASAYRTLSDPGRRAEYDASLTARVDRNLDAAGWAGEVDATSDSGRRRERSGQRLAGGSRGRRLGVGAAFGVTWYLVRATGVLSWIVGGGGTGRPLSGEVETWARPVSLGKLLVCAAFGVFAASWRPVVHAAARIGTMRRSPVRSALIGLVVCAALLSEHLLTIEGRRILFVGSILLVAPAALSWEKRRVMSSDP